MMKTGKTSFCKSKNKLMVALPLAALAAHAAPAAEYAIAENVSFNSDYIFNGIPQDVRSHALEGAFDYVRTGGLYLGT